MRKSEAPLYKIYRKDCVTWRVADIYRALSWHAGNLGVLASELLNIHEEKCEPCRHFSFVHLAATLLQNPHRLCSFSSKRTRNTDIRDFTYTFTSLRGATVYKQRGVIWPAHSFLCLLRGNRHFINTHMFTCTNRHYNSFIFCLYFSLFKKKWGFLC